MQQLHAATSLAAEGKIYTATNINNSIMLMEIDLLLVGSCAPDGGGSLLWEDINNAAEWRRQTGPYI